jgi:hypothetical protein
LNALSSRAAPKRALPKLISNGELLRRALAWVVDERIFAHLSLHGNTSWSAAHLVVLTILWVWSERKTLTGAFDEAHFLSGKLLGQAPLASYQGLTGALAKWNEQLLTLIQKRLQQLMQRAGGKHWRIGKWLPLAVDGSRLSVPRTKSNERAFSAQNFGKGKKARSRLKWKNKQKRSKRLAERVKPQIWLTLVWHMGLKMPWHWRKGPSTASEREHFLNLLQTEEYPQNTLFCADAGFVSYQLWKTILERGQSFLLRVGGNASLLRQLDYTCHRKGLVHCWPRRERQKQNPPLTLRLIELSGPRGKVYLLTNILSEAELSRAQASELYQLRWGVEVQFRSFKQTFGRRKLRSRTPQHALAELDWSLVGLWIAQLFAIKEQLQVQSPPRRCSVAGALAVVRHAMRTYAEVAPPQQRIRMQLRLAVGDRYQRHTSKKARYNPHYQEPPSATKPKILKATCEQRRAFKLLQTAA